MLLKLCNSYFILLLTYWPTGRRNSFNLLLFAFETFWILILIAVRDEHVLQMVKPIYMPSTNHWNGFSFNFHIIICGQRHALLYRLWDISWSRFYFLGFLKFNWNIGEPHARGALRIIAVFLGHIFSTRMCNNLTIPLTIWLPVSMYCNICTHSVILMD